MEGCSEARAGLAEGAAETHTDTIHLMNLEERGQPFKQRREKNIPWREDCLTKTRSLEKRWYIHAQRVSVCRRPWGDWLAMRLKKHKTRLRRLLDTMARNRDFKEKIAQEPRWEMGGGHVSSLWKVTAYTERALRSVQKFAQCLLYMWVTHSLLYEPGDRPYSKTNWSTGIPQKGHSQGVERLEFHFRQQYMTQASPSLF